MAKKESEFVKRIKKLERDGYEVDGAIILFTSEQGASALNVEGNCSSPTTIVLRANEHLKFELDMIEARRKQYVEKETGFVFDNDEKENPGYTG